MYRMLMGSMPYVSTSVNDLLDEIVNGEYQITSLFILSILNFDQHKLCIITLTLKLDGVLFSLFFK